MVSLPLLQLGLDSHKILFSLDMFSILPCGLLEYFLKKKEGKQILIKKGNKKTTNIMPEFDYHVNKFTIKFNIEFKFTKNP